MLQIGAQLQFRQMIKWSAEKESLVWMVRAHDQPPTPKNLGFFPPRQWYLPCPREANRIATPGAQFLQMLNRGCLSGGHFVLREQTAPHPTPNPKEKQGKACLLSKPLAIPRTEAVPEHSWVQSLVAPGRAGRVELQPLATLGPTALMSEAEVGNTEANLGQDQPVSA